MYYKSTGRTYNYYQLLESRNTKKGPRNSVVLHIGTLNITDTEQKILSNLVDRKIKGLSNIVRFSDKLEQLAEQIYFKYLRKMKNSTPDSTPNSTQDSISITRESIEIGYHRSVGIELLASHYWKALKFDRIFKSCSFTDKEIELSKIAILGRLISPGSECHTTRWFNKQSSLSEFLLTIKEEINKDVLYRIGDKLLCNKDLIEPLLRKNLKKVHSLVDRVYLYDLTNTYFEGSKRNSELCKRGKCKKRTNNPLVTLALVVDQDGFPVLSRIYKGNQSEPKTLKDILNELYSEYDNLIDKVIAPSIVMDRGIATAENIEYLKAHNYSYFVVERRDTVKDFGDYFSDMSSFEEYGTTQNDRIYLKKVIEGEIARVLVYSTGKQQKEKGIIGKKEERFLEEAERLISGNQKGYIKDSDKIMIRIGRLMEKYSQIAGKYNFQMTKDKKEPQKVTEIKLMLSGNNPTKSEYPGCYVIITDNKDLRAKDIWDFYMKLSEVEASFRALKSELGTRPIYHKRDDRVESHLFLSVLAYSILKSITYTLGKKDYHISWTGIKEILQTHMRSTIQLIDTEGYKHNIRQNSTPEVEAAGIYKQLNIKVHKNQSSDKVRV